MCRPRKRSKNADTIKKEHVEALEQRAKDSILHFIRTVVCRPGDYLDDGSMIMDFLTRMKGLVPDLKSDGDDRHRLALKRLVLTKDTAGIIELCSTRLAQLAK